MIAARNRMSWSWAVLTFAVTCVGVPPDSWGQRGVPTAPSKTAATAIPFKDTPAAKTAPPALRRMIEDGDVTVEFTDDPELVLQDKGKTRWHFDVKRTYRYRHSTSTKDGAQTVRLTATEVNQEVRLWHRIRLPPKYYQNSPRVWYSRLMRHEFDHVAVSLDPRPKLLMQYLSQHVPPFERTLPPGEQRSPETYKRFVGDELQKRFAAVLQLVERNQNWLDDISQHGKVPVPNRLSFFPYLYTRERLQEAQFPYLAEALPLLGTEEYQKAVLPFVPIDPTRRL